VAALSPAVLAIDPAREAERIAAGLARIVARELGRRGAVVGVSGGVDSAVTAALCARALGSDRVLAVLTPERESAADTLALSRLVVDRLGIGSVLEDVTPILEAAGAYGRRDAAIRRLVPDYGPGWRAKLVLPDILGSDRIRVFSLVAEGPDGRRVRARMTARTYLEVVAATSFKQRARKMVEYYHADRLSYAVAGTPNRLEYDQGFFVKAGDGAADVKPIAHLYKTQVYRLGEHLGLPEEVLRREPTTDTYPLPQDQEEFFFSLPFEKLDLCLYARDQGLPAEAVAEAVGLPTEDVERVFRDIDRKRRAARYLHAPPLLLGLD